MSIGKKDYLPLVNKYTLTNIDDLILTPELRTIINKIKETKHINKTIFSGNTGTGKTLLVNLLVKELLGDQYDDGCLNLTTSSARGLINLKDILPRFCVTLNSKLRERNIAKIVLMDEADNITTKAQNLITNMMSEYPDTTFIFTCNDSSKLVEDIQSNCTLINLPNIKTEDSVPFLTKICEKEKIKYTMEGLNLIAENCNGDMRSTINLLDSVRCGFSTVNIKNVTELLYNPSTMIVKEIIKSCALKNLYKAFEELDRLKAKGFCSTDILVALNNSLERVRIDEHVRLGYIEIVSRMIKEISNGLDSELQLYGCISQMLLFE